MDETTVLDEKTEEEVPQEEITSRKSRHSKHNKPKRGKSGDKKGGGRKVLLIALCVIMAIAVINAVVIFAVYGGRHIFLRAELGEGAPEASAFMKNGADASYETEPDISLTEEGKYIVRVVSGGKVRPQLLIVRDTKAPEVVLGDAKISIDEKSMDPKDAFTEIKDASEYTVKWLTEPQYGTAGSYDCAIELKDSHDNSRTVKLTVKVLGLVDVLEYEAGQPHPRLKDFMAVERDDAKLVTDMSTIAWDTLGDYEVKAEFDGKTFTSTLRIVDTTAPDPDMVPAAVLKDNELEPSALALNGGDATKVSYEFVSAPKTSKIGTVECTVKATDEGGNSVERTGKVIVCDVLAELEASTDMLTERMVLSALGADYAGYKMESEPFELTSLGAHEIILTKGDERVTVGLTVKDTVAPTAEGISCDCSTGYYCAPIKFVTNVADMSRVTARFVSEPDWDTEGEQSVQIILTDRAGNETTVDAKAMVSPDTAPPVIYAARDRYCYVGDAVAYFKEVFAEDNADPEPKIDVDKSKVDPKTAGVYDVTYTATDHEGNKSSVTVKFTFIEKKISDEQLDAQIDKVLGEILEPGMTVPEQAYAIFEYCYDNIAYYGGSDKTDWKSEAYKGLTEHHGDCYTFYATSYALLQKIDCQVLSVERLNGKTQHFWCLVNLGTGWYHYDTCNVGPEHLKCFMKTSEELVKYSIQYWRFDTTLYPTLETTPYTMG